MRKFVFLIFIVLTGCDIKSSNEYLRETGELEDNGKYAEAITLLNDAINTYPELKEAYLSRGADKSALKDYKGAILDYEATLKIDPKNTLALYNIGNNYKRLNQPLRAIAYYNSAFKTKGGGVFYMDYVPNEFAPEYKFDVHGYEISYERGLAYFKVDSLRRAYEDFRNSIKANYSADVSYYYLGIILKAYRQNAKACECFVKARELGYKDSIKEFDELCKSK